MGTQIMHSYETKMKVVELRNKGWSHKDIQAELGIKNKMQIETWLRWHRNGETHRFN